MREISKIKIEVETLLKGINGIEPVENKLLNDLIEELGYECVRLNGLISEISKKNGEKNLEVTLYKELENQVFEFKPQTEEEKKMKEYLEALMGKMTELFSKIVKLSKSGENSKN